MAAKQIVAGFDGGGTRTRVLLMDSMGTVLGMGTSGPSNFDDVGFKIVRDNLRAALESAWATSALERAPLAAAFLGMAGVTSAKDHAAIRQMAADLEIAPPEKVGVDHDIRIALTGGLAGTAGVALIVGTGSSCYGRTEDGQSWRAGGWGYLLDDEGSAYALGLGAIRSVGRAVDGRGQKTSLVEPIMAALGVDDPEEIMHRLYVDGFSRTEIAALASLTIQAAEENDDVACAILKKGAEDLALMVEVVVRKLGLRNAGLRVTLAGGVAAASPFYRGWIETAIGERVPEAETTLPLLPPVIGACLLALDGIDIRLSEEVITRLGSAEVE